MAYAASVSGQEAPPADGGAEQEGADPPPAGGAPPAAGDEADQPPPDGAPPAAGDGADQPPADGAPPAAGDGAGQPPAGGPPPPAGDSNPPAGDNNGADGAPAAGAQQGGDHQAAGTGGYHSSSSYQATTYTPATGTYYGTTARPGATNDNEEMYHGTEGDKGDYNDYGDDMNESEIPREWWRHTQTGDKTEYAATHETACPEALDATYLQIHDLCKNEHEAPKVELVYTKTSGGYDQLFWGEWKRPADGKSICDDKTVRDLNMYKFLPGVYTADCETDADCPHTTNDCTLHCVQQVGRQEKKCEPR